MLFEDFQRVISSFFKNFSKESSTFPFGYTKKIFSTNCSDRNKKPEEEKDPNGFCAHYYQAYHPFKWMRLSLISQSALKNKKNLES
jgi:hypothetical protein